MRAVRCTVLIAVVAALAGSAAAAQPAERPLTALEQQVACAAPPSLDVPDKAPRIVGSQDTQARFIFEARDLLVIGGGISGGMQLGQKYYIRRPMFVNPDRRNPRAILTLGWLTVVAVNDTTSIGAIDHFCDGIAPGDYLEAYAPPVVPADADRDEPSGDLDFSMMGRVASGVQNHASVGIGNLMLIDLGAENGVTSGRRFAVYRDMRTSGLPLANVAEAVVVSTGKTMSLARVTRSRDAVVAGDYVVPRK